jgi:MYXO-CTERM domain-containing protein
MRFLRALALALPILFVSSTALANGRYPLAGQVVEDPDNPKHLVVRATYGLLITNDFGKSWGWVCEPAVNILNSEDPMMGIAHGGNILASVFKGLSVAKDNGCDFALYPPLKNKYVVDLAIDKLNPANGVLVISNSVSDTKFLSQLWQTSDGANTWTQAGVDLPDDFVGITVDSAPSDPNTIYVSGRFGPPDFQGALEKSTDRGATWQKLPIPTSNNQNLPYVGAIDPTTADRVYVRLNADASDTLVVSDDGGLTWSQKFKAKGALLGLALSPDGSEIAFGGDKDGIYLASTTDLTPKKVSKVGARCLTWTAQGLYACGDEFVDGFEVGISKDEGKTFTPLFHLQTLCDVLSCPADSTTGKLCPSLLGATETSIMSNCGTQPTGAGAGDGVGGANPASTSGTGAGGDPSTSGGCGCATRGDSSNVTGALAIAAAISLMLGRRRKLALCTPRGGS